MFQWSSIISAALNTSNTSTQKNTSDSIMIEGFDVPLSAKVTLIWEGPHLHWKSWNDDFIEAYMDRHGTELRKVAELWNNADGLKESHTGIDFNCHYDLFSRFVKKEDWGPSYEKDHPMDGYIEAKWQNVKHMLERSSPSMINLATKMRLIIGEHAVLELTRFEIDARHFGHND